MPVYVLDAVTKEISRSYLRSIRVALVTDAADQAGVPAACFDIADEVHCGSLNEWPDCPQTADAVVALFKGESLISGTFRSLRHLLLEPARQYYVPVHHPGVPALDLIAIEPRWGRRNATEEVTSSHWRIAASAEPSAEVIHFLARQTSVWARLSLALWIAREDPGQSIDRLSALLGESPQPWLQALTLRNLIILLWRAGKFQEGSALVDRGMQMFSTCAEFFFIAAVREWSAQRVAETLRFAQQAIEIEQTHGRGAWVGSGGEGSYRAHALMATVAEHLGDHKSAFYNFLPGLRAIPPFAESVYGILRQEIPPAIMDWFQYELRNVARMYPEFRPEAIQFLHQNHRPMAAMLLENAQPGTPAPLLPMVEQSQPSAAASGRLGIQFAGPLFIPGQDSRMLRAVVHSFARQPSAELEFCVENEEFPLDSLRSPRDREPFASHHIGELAHVDLTIRVHEHPRFDKPASGRLAILLMQQLSAIPVAWNTAIRRNVDYVLAPSGYVRKTLLQAGIADAKILDLPPFVDPTLYTPGGGRTDLFAGNTVFLFPAPCTLIHGIDILLNAWDRAFTANDRVTLVLWHDGPMAPVAERTLQRIHQRVAASAGAPVRWLDGPLPDDRRAALLRSADVTVLPYRMEATAQTLLESIACGTPVIASAIEPCREVAPVAGDAALFIEGSLQPLPLSEQSQNFWMEPPLSLECDPRAWTNALRRALAERTALRAAATRVSPAILLEYGEASETELNRLLRSLAAGSGGR